MELTFCDLRAKEVINIIDGKRLGNIIDLVIDCNCARVVGIVVPYDKGFFNFFKNNQDIFIPWHKICKIGKDVILVELTPHNLPVGCAPCEVRPFKTMDGGNAEQVIYPNSQT